MKPFSKKHMYRKIIHIDMDSFFASVEQRDNPDFDDEHTIRLIGLSVSNPKEEIEKHGVWVEQEIQFED